jgi:hypothetical protein
MATEENLIPKMAALRVRRQLCEMIADFIHEGSRAGFDLGFEIRESASGKPILEITSHNSDLVLTVEGEDAWPE